MIAWQPFPGPQTEFCSRWEFEALYGGAAGPGKTDCIVAEVLRYVHEPRYNGILLRRTFPQLQEIIDRTRSLYPALGGEYRTGEHRWYFPSGARVNLGHIQHEGDEYNYQGKEYQFVGFDEATQFTAKQYLYLFSRCRSSDRNIPCRIRASTNPGGPGHQFIKDRFRIGHIPSGTTYVDPDTKLSRVFIQGRLSDNPALLTNDPDYVKRLMQLPEIERLRLMEGIWDAFEGQAFRELNVELHGFDFEVPPEWPRYRSFDWGYSTPFSVGWWAVDPDGVIYRYREWYGTKEPGSNEGLRMSPQDIARGIREREQGEKVHPGPADPDIWNPRWKTMRGGKFGVIGGSVMEDMANEGVHWISADNDRILGRQQVHKRLQMDENGRPQVRVHVRNCQDFWRTMPLMREHHVNPEDIESKDVEDHIYSETRYMCMFRPMRPASMKRDDAGSFQAERRRLIRAKQLAATRGISMAEAYRRSR